MTKNPQEVINQLEAKIPRDAVASRQGGGGSKPLSYVETWWVIDELNQIFGNLGWDSETVDMVLLSAPGEKAAYRAKVRLTAIVSTGDGGYMKVVKEGTGWGSDKSGLNPHEMACKEAESDALKRAAMKFGKRLGLALYDKTQEFVEDAPKAVAQAPKPAPAQTVKPSTSKTPDPDAVAFYRANPNPDREAVNKLITAEANVALAKAGPKDSKERAAKLAELKALTKAHGAETKEELTDAKAKELLAKLKEMNNG